MPTTTITKDLPGRRLTVVVELDAPVERCWELWADPRQLERWWGPPTYPATVEVHELRAGGRVTYFMTGPEGDQHHGYWDVVAVDPPNRIELRDGFADDTGAADPDLPVSETVVTFEPADAGCTMTILSTYPTTEALAQVLEMGMEEGLTAALGQIDAVLAG